MFDKGFRLITELKKLKKDSTAYIVGGAVRDYIIGKDCDDIDIATDVPMDIIEDKFSTHDIGSNKDFGIIVVEFEGDVFEVAQYRSDGDYSDGRRPDAVELGVDIFDDSCRRDFTINAMYMDENKSIIDFHHGEDDIKKKLIRCVGDSDIRLTEDYLRMFRAFRFSSVLDFDIDDDIINTISGYGYNIKKVSTERIWKELWKMGSGIRFSENIGTMYELGFLQDIFPEFIDMEKYPHYKHHHPEGNVLNHVMGVLTHLDNQSAVVKLAGMFHDIGKSKAYEVEESGKFHYFKHEHIGVRIFEDIAKRIHIPKAIVNEISYVIKNHMRFHKFLEMKDSKCVLLMDSPYWDTLYAVAHADDRSRLYLYDHKFWGDVDDKIKRIKSILDRKTIIDDIINGNLVMTVCDIEGGADVGRILNLARTHIIDKGIELDYDGIEYIKKYIKGCI